MFILQCKIEGGMQCLSMSIMILSRLVTVAVVKINSICKLLEVKKKKSIPLFVLIESCVDGCLYSAFGRGIYSIPIEIYKQIFCAIGVAQMSYCLHIFFSVTSLTFLQSWVLPSTNEDTQKQISKSTREIGQAPSQHYYCLFMYRISIIKIRWLDRLIFIMGIPILVRRRPYIETPS